MSISPPSDIVMDVARAAEPTRYRQAVSRLGAAAPAEPFGEVLASEKADSPRASTRPPPMKTESVPAATIAQAKAAEGTPDQQRTRETYRRFEAMALANMLESSMTTSTSSFFGGGIAGDTWKSLLVEQIADQMAKAGGIGIAAQLARGAEMKLADDDTLSRTAERTMANANLEQLMLRKLGPVEPQS